MTTYPSNETVVTRLIELVTEDIDAGLYKNDEPADTFGDLHAHVDANDYFVALDEEFGFDHLPFEVRIQKANRIGDLFNERWVDPRPARKLEAANTVAKLCYEALLDRATNFTCEEANAVAEFIKLFNDTEDAQAFIDSHAAGDEEGDLHFNTRYTNDINK